MHPQEVIRRLRFQPFEPFRICLSDGRVFLVKHPEQALVTPTRIDLGVPGPAGVDGPMQEVVSIALIHVVSLEPLSAVAPSAV